MLRERSETSTAALGHGIGIGWSGFDWSGLDDGGLDDGGLWRSLGRWRSIVLATALGSSLG
jgi:hypothetical protein